LNDFPVYFFYASVQASDLRVPEAAKMAAVWGILPVEKKNTQKQKKEME